MATGLRYILHRIDSLLNLLGVHFPTDTKAKHLQGHSVTPLVSCFMVVEHVCVYACYSKCFWSVVILNFL